MCGFLFRRTYLLVICNFFQTVVAIFNHKKWGSRRCELLQRKNFIRPKDFPISAGDLHDASWRWLDEISSVFNIILFLIWLIFRLRFHLLVWNGMISPIGFTLFLESVVRLRLRKSYMHKSWIQRQHDIYKITIRFRRRVGSHANLIIQLWLELAATRKLRSCSEFLRKFVSSIHCL